MLEEVSIAGDRSEDAQLAAARTIWTDPKRPQDERVAALLSVMTLEEKLAQLVGAWVGGSEGEDVAPAQHELNAGLPPWAELVRHGLGQLTRFYGTAPIDPAAGARGLARAQRDVQRCRLGIPAMVHEECLTGFTAWKATVFPSPLAWAASFDPDLVRRMAESIGAGMRSLGVHQGLAPVLDVSRDPRWGRTEETLGEDPYLVGMLAAAYVSGLESTGVVATLKHFAGHSWSRAGRNQAPAPLGPREFADVAVLPFEYGLRLGGARSVMPSYAAVDGVPPTGDPELLTELLRDRWGFTGTVVSDYFAVSFLESQHQVGASSAEAAALALAAGVDVELPSVRCYGQPLLAAVRAGTVPEDLVDRALTRVLAQKCELGLLDADWSPEPPVLADSGGCVDLDPPHQRELAARLAESSVVLLDNERGLLPLRAPRSVAVVGPCADNLLALMGCYAFPSHVGEQHPEVPLGVDFASLLDAVGAEWPAALLSYAPGVELADSDGSGISAAVDTARQAEVCVVAVGDRSGLFGRGTSGEGCDAPDLRLPGGQHELVEALLDSGIPVILVLLSGRPYALGAYAGRAAAIVQAFFPGQLGAQAVAGVLSGRVNPSGRLPVQVPATPAGGLSPYLHAPLDGPSGSSSWDPSPLYPFGYGLSYTRFGYSDLAVSCPELATDGELEVSVTVRNTGPVDGAEVVQLYLHDLQASVVRPVCELVGFARVPLAAGESRRVRFTLHADRFSFTGRDLRRIVEPGEVRVRVAASSSDPGLAATLTLTGPVREVGHDRVLDTPVAVE